MQLQDVWARLRHPMADFEGAADRLAERRRQLKQEFTQLDSELEKDERMIRAYEAQLALNRQLEAEAKKKASEK